MRVRVVERTHSVVGNGGQTTKEFSDWPSIESACTHLKPVVPRPSRKVFPSLIPLALKNLNFRTVMTALAPSCANQLLPAPSGPAGHSVLLMLSKPARVVEGEGSMCASARGTGTSEEEKGVAPAEKGTFGLLVPLSATELFPKEARKEPVKMRLLCDELDVIDRTSPAAPDRPPNGGGDQEDDLVFQIATEGDGDANPPPAHTLLFESSQNSEWTAPSGPFVPRAVKESDDGE